MKYIQLCSFQHQLKHLATAGQRVVGPVVRKWLSGGGMGPDNAVTLARLVTGADGCQGILFGLDDRLEPGETFKWIVLAGTVGVNGPVDTPRQPAQRRPRFLPSLFSVADISARELYGHGHIIDGDIARILREWQPDQASGKATAEALHQIRSLAPVVLGNMDITVELFGSRSYGICKSSSDIDVAIHMAPDTPRWDVDMSYIGPRFRNALRRRDGFSKVLWLGHARVPIIKFDFYYAGKVYEGDISFGNELGPTKTRLLRAYMLADRRVSPVLAMLKHWGERRQITNSNVLNSFGLMMMALAFLIDERVVPPLQLLSTVGGFGKDSAGAGAVSLESAYGQRLCLQTNEPLLSESIDGHECYFLCDEDELGRWHSPNDTPAHVLLLRMFRYYGAVFNPVADAISPRLGRKSIPRHALHKLNALDPRRLLAQTNRWRNDLRLLAIEDPFELTVNCGRNAPPEWVEGLLWEMRRAAWAMHQGLRSAQGAVLKRLFLPPSLDIYCDAGVWAPAFRRLVSQLNSKSGKAIGDDESLTMNLAELEASQLGA
ncbi:hypothetical protein H4R19_003160 [Coemansia spiralis]|nr:hypothetical protein H4R19_003160 [Coemansia spiralis]